MTLDDDGRLAEREEARQRLRHRCRGNVLFARGEFAEAADEFRRCGDGDFRALSNLSAALLRLGQLPEGVAVAEKLVLGFPAWAKGRWRLGVAQSNAAAPGVALEHFSAAVRLEPGSEFFKAELAKQEAAEARRVAGRDSMEHLTRIRGCGSLTGLATIATAYHRAWGAMSPADAVRIEIRQAVLAAAGAGGKPPASTRFFWSQGYRFWMEGLIGARALYFSTGKGSQQFPEVAEQIRELQAARSPDVAALDDLLVRNFGVSASENDWLDRLYEALVLSPRNASLFDLKSNARLPHWTPEDTGDGMYLLNWIVSGIHITGKHLDSEPGFTRYGRLSKIHPRWSDSHGLLLPADMMRHATPVAAEEMKTLPVGEALANLLQRRRDGCSYEDREGKLRFTINFLVKSTTLIAQIAVFAGKYDFALSLLEWVVAFFEGVDQFLSPKLRWDRESPRGKILLPVMQSGALQLLMEVHRTVRVRTIGNRSYLQNNTTGEMGLYPEEREVDVALRIIRKIEVQQAQPAVAEKWHDVSIYVNPQLAYAYSTVASWSARAGEVSDMASPEQQEMMRNPLNAFRGNDPQDWLFDPEQGGWLPALPQWSQVNYRGLAARMYASAAQLQNKDHPDCEVFWRCAAFNMLFTGPHKDETKAYFSMGELREAWKRADEAGSLRDTDMIPFSPDDGSLPVDNDVVIYVPIVLKWAAGLSDDDDIPPVLGYSEESDRGLAMDIKGAMHEVTKQEAVAASVAASVPDQVPTNRDQPQKMFEDEAKMRSPFADYVGGGRREVPKLAVLCLDQLQQSPDPDNLLSFEFSPTAAAELAIGTTEPPSDWCVVCGTGATRLKVCGRCKKRRFCTVHCQRYDWEKAGHKTKCSAD